MVYWQIELIGLDQAWIFPIGRPRGLFLLFALSAPAEVEGVTNRVAWIYCSAALIIVGPAARLGTRVMHKSSDNSEGK